MVVVKIMPNSYMDKNAVADLIHYALTDKGTGECVRYRGSLGVDSCSAERMVGQFQIVKRAFDKTGGRQVRHLIVSFSDDENMGPFCTYAIGFKIAEYFGDCYQVVFGVHEDSARLHIHLIINTVSYIDGKMYSKGPNEAKELEQYINGIVRSFKAVYEVIPLEVRLEQFVK